MIIQKRKEFRARPGFLSLDMTPPFRCVKNGTVAGTQRSVPRTRIDLRFCS
jgi:hypothetical protein